MMISERPFFCRVEPDVFDTLYGIDKKKFNKEACRLHKPFGYVYACIFRLLNVMLMVFC